MTQPEAVTADSLAQVFAQYQGELTGKAGRLLGDAGVPESVADADDIVSSAFATALLDPSAVRQPRPYLHKLIRTEVVHLATRLGEHRRLDEKRAADPLCRLAPDVADFSALVENRDAVYRAAQGLSIPQRTAVWATHAVGYTRAETAVLMDKHPGTVARQSTRALVLLRAAIAAVIVGVLTSIGFAVGDALQRTTPADDPHGGPALPSMPGWPELPEMEALPAFLLALYAVSWLVVTARVRGRHRVPTRLRQPQPMAPLGPLAARSGTSIASATGPGASAQNAPTARRPMRHPESVGAGVVRVVGASGAPFEECPADPQEAFVT
ncbi:DNA-directed RNA polymerase specialized sigma24 family protein [Streptomyces aurantiacus]|uniref:RNA polymerase sigma factor n=1 Tax=Streptomyces aurantiacus TaxID=47760 RepID=UPI00278D0F52|nr:RNA polymerase sigma factor [Streptomyces aurantiacus]MDQ0772897.1 DNA-directed RNA polymerase specialized sigma24 family protein [Streptomyces aurantiacus]